VHSTSLQLKSGYKDILLLTLPISFALIIPFLNVTINNYFIGHIGESELGTAGLTGVFYLIIAVIGNGLNSALQSMMSRKAGENKPEEIGKIFGRGLITATIFSIVAIALTYLLAPLLFQYAIRNAEIRERVLDFIYVRVWGLPFLYLFQSGNALLVGTTNSRYLFVGTVFQAGSNILFDYLLIFGHWGLPELGFQGAAWASVLSEIVGMLVVFSLILFKKMHTQFALFKHINFDRDKIIHILKTSAPLIAQYGISLISWFFFYTLIEHKGERALAISNIMRNVFMFCGIFIWAFASATNTMVSNTIGQKKEKDVIPLIHRIMRLSFAFSLIVCLFLNLFTRICLEFFGMPEGFVTEAEPVMRIVTAGFLLMSISVVALNAVTGTGDTTINLLAELAAIIIYCIYSYYVIEIKNYSLNIAWASEIIYWIIILAITYSYMRTGKWEKFNSPRNEATD
jgi:MATE family multidrug resistance protein